MTVKTRSNLQSDINTYIADNSSGDISEADVRQRFIDVTDSMKMAEDPVAGNEATCAFRATLASNTPVTTTDQLAKTTLYVTPMNGNKIGLYTSGAWVVIASAEVSLSLSGFAANTNFDIFGYYSSGNLVLEALAWTSDTARATAVALQDGIWVKSGDPTRRLIATIRTTGTIGQCEDSVNNRLVSNVYNRVPRPMNYLPSVATWTITAVNNNTIVTQLANNNNGAKLGYVDCLGIAMPQARMKGNKSGTTGTVTYYTEFIALDAVSTSSLVGIYDGTNLMADYAGNPGAGYHFLAWIESIRGGAAGSNTQTVVGLGALSVQSGIVGSVIG